jgi:hypothetical protein
MEAQLEQHSGQLGDDRRLAVDALERELAHSPGAHGPGERLQRLGEDISLLPGARTAAEARRGPGPPRSTRTAATIRASASASG